MPLTVKGKKVLAAMKRQYGDKKGERVFYSSQNKGAIKGTHKNPHKNPHKKRRKKSWSDNL